MNLFLYFTHILLVIHRKQGIYEVTNRYLATTKTDIRHKNQKQNYEYPIQGPHIIQEVATKRLYQSQKYNTFSQEIKQETIKIDTSERK